MKRIRAAWQAKRISVIGEIWPLIAVPAFTYAVIADGYAGRWTWFAEDLAILAVVILGWRYLPLGKPNPSAREFIKVARTCRSGDIYLNRDNHVILTCKRDLWAVTVTVMDEDDLTEIDREGEGPVVATAFIMPRTSGAVVRRVSGWVFDRDGREVTSGDKPRFRTWRELSAMRRGLMDATPAEVRQVITLLRAAERINPEKGTT